MVVGELVERCRSSSALSRTGGQLVVHADDDRQRSTSSSSSPGAALPASLAVGRTQRLPRIIPEPDDMRCASQTDPVHLRYRAERCAAPVQGRRLSRLLL
jgi:hypothetical protein